MKTSRNISGTFLGTLATGLLLCHPALAGTNHVNVSTNALNGAGTYYVEFTLTDGSALGDGNSKATVSNFTLTGGTLGAVNAPTLGTVTGSLGSGHNLVLTDSDTTQGGLADFTQAFTTSSPTSSFGFDLTLFNTGLDTPTPDAFTLQILDSDFIPVPTTGPTGAEFVSADFTSFNPTPKGFISTDPNVTPPITATISQVSATPEPSSVASLALGGLGVLGLMLRTRRKAVH